MASSYDILNRPLTVTEADGSVMRMSYQGFTTQVTNALNQVSTQVKNSQGQLVRSTDALNNSNTYDPFGNLTQTLDAAGNRTTHSYDIRGRKIAMTDPDMGHWVYGYNTLGELIYQRDAKAQVTTMTYDKLGRMTRRSESESTSTWGYDGAFKGLGKLQMVTGPNGYLRTQTYDSLGRDSKTATTIDGEVFDMFVGYDSGGRLCRLVYPTGFAINYVYNTLGYLSRIRDTATNALYWQASVHNAEGQLTQALLGNGLTTVQSYDELGHKQSISTGLGTASTVQSLYYKWDSLDNLDSRYDDNQYISERFTYDSLNRLTSADVSRVGAKTYQYDSIGNITYKSDVGSYLYGNGIAGPHAVTSTSGIKTASYTYDGNGNQLSGAGRSLTWASYNLPTRITQGSAADTFTYDPERVRISQVNNAGKTIYLNPRWDLGTHFEKITDNAGNITYKHCISAGKEIIDIRVIHDNGIQKTKYLHYDHIGSLDAATDEAGQVIERLSYDAHGKRRQTNWQDATGLITSGITTHGFTGHEHLDSVGLIHMNGRVYDPELGRFLSADPTIQYPDPTQNFNRYSRLYANIETLTG